MTKQELQQVFESPFEWGNWRKVMDFVFPEFQFSAQKIPIDQFTKAAEERIKGFYHHGASQLNDNVSLNLYEVELKGSVNLPRNVKGIRKFIAAEAIANTQASIAVFYSPDKTKWRFTLALKHLDENFKEVDKKPESFTYVFGDAEKGRTAAEQFFKLAKAESKSLKDLEEAFSVERLSREFFTQYKAIYEQFVTDIIQNKSKINLFRATSQELQEKASRDFVKKMMGRIVFLYFLQKKGWMGCKTRWKGGDEQFMKHLFEAADKNSSFYMNYLEPLFFETLNAKRVESEEDCVIHDTLFGKVPFLNGGLFEREDTHPENLTLEWDTFNRLFEVLNNYNFTIIEDDPDFKEVAVDPEMLGHIFENLLEENRNKTGAFYTPKEIVQYMCQESIIEYLHTKLSEKVTSSSLKDAIRDLVIRHEFSSLNDLDQKSDKYILKALKEIKVCDPAIGSGAFPMGILLEIFRIIELFSFGDAFLSIWDMEWDPARVKEEIISNSIYGVDIEKGAVDIARLRFWLSIIIDEEKPKPLPNLDYKIVVGNSLLNKFEDHVINIEWEIKKGTQSDTKTERFLERRSELLKQISDKQKAYFDAESSERDELSQEIKDLKIDILVNQLEMKIANEGKEEEPQQHNYSRKINFEKAQRLYFQTLGWKKVIGELNGIKGTDKPFNHFDWSLDFPEILNRIINKEKSGFDVVIGNPPYLGNKEIGAMNQIVYENEFGYKDDMYVYFFDRSKNILLHEGLLCFITSNTFKTLLSKRHLRQKLLALHILEFFEVGYVFEEAYVNTVITILKNSKTDEYEVVFKETNSTISQSKEYSGSVSLFMNSWNNVFFIPSPLNLRLNSRIAESANKQYEDVEKWIYNANAFKKNKSQIKNYFEDLQENDIGLLALSCEGAQGLVTGNNSKYLAKIVKSKAEKSAMKLELIEKIVEVDNFYNFDNLSKKSEEELHEIAEVIKKDKGKPSIFGKFFLYKSVLETDISNFDDLKDDEKLSGTKSQTYIRYYRGNDEGQRWICPVDEAIIWTEDSVKELKEGRLTNSRWQGSELYSCEGFGWVDYFTNKIKAFVVPSAPYSKNIVKFHSIFKIENEFLVAFLNSSFCSYYVKNFITNTHTLQINDGKVIPILIPSKTVQVKIVKMVNEIIDLIKNEGEYESIENDIDCIFFKLYGIEYKDVITIIPDFWLTEEEYNNLNLEEDV